MRFSGSIHVVPDHVAFGIDTVGVRRCGSREIDGHEMERAARAALGIGSESGNGVAKAKQKTMTLLLRVGVLSHELA